MERGHGENHDFGTPIDLSWACCTLLHRKGQVANWMLNFSTCSYQQCQATSHSCHSASSSNFEPPPARTEESHSTNQIWIGRLFLLPRGFYNFQSPIFSFLLVNYSLIWVELVVKRKGQGYIIFFVDYEVFLQNNKKLWGSKSLVIRIRDATWPVYLLDFFLEDVCILQLRFVNFVFRNLVKIHEKKFNQKMHKDKKLFGFLELKKHILGHKS